MIPTPRQILLTLLALVATVLLFEYSDLNLFVQDRLYDFASGHWRVDRDEPVARFFFYDGIKKLYVGFVLALLATLLFFFRSRWLRAYRRGLVVVLLACILVPLAVGELKAQTNVPCPKSLQRYGGPFPHVTLLHRWPDGTCPSEVQRCYPAGHASGGFALMSLFFLFRDPRRRRIALAAAVAVGWTIGIYKMAIGDHFLGHTAVSMVLAWLLIQGIAYVVMVRDSARARPQAETLPVLPQVASGE